MNTITLVNMYIIVNSYHDYNWLCTECNVCVISHPSNSQSLVYRDGIADQWLQVLCPGTQSYQSYLLHVPIFKSP